MKLIAKGLAAGVNAVLNMPYGMKMGLLYTFLSVGVTHLASRIFGRRKKKSNVVSTVTSASKKSSKKSKTYTKEERARYCKAFTASVKKLEGMKKRTAAQTRALKAARVGKAKFCKGI